MSLVLVPILEFQHAPLPSKVLRGREQTPTPYLSIVFTFVHAIESIKEFGILKFQLKEVYVCVVLGANVKACNI
jgi:hypothetical protein